MVIGQLYLLDVHKAFLYDNYCPRRPLKAKFKRSKFLNFQAHLHYFNGSFRQFHLIYRCIILFANEKYSQNSCTLCLKQKLPNFETV